MMTFVLFLAMAIAPLTAFRYGNRKRDGRMQIRLDPFLHMSTVWASGACGRPVISDTVMRF
jgi:hypothetical protein